jgi:hypothetical protein
VQRKVTSKSLPSQGVACSGKHTFCSGQACVQAYVRHDPTNKGLTISTSPTSTWCHAPDHCAQSTHLHTLLRVAVPNAGPGLTPLGTCVLHADGANLPADALANATGRTQLNDAIVIILNLLLVLRARSWAHRMKRCLPAAIRSSEK